MQFDKRGSRSLFLVGLILWSSVTVGRADEPVPPPAQTPVEIVVSGRTSTLKSITIRNVGQTIPETFSGKRVKNTDGFTWYVSRHYALKTNYGEDKARHYLTLLELAFPHYVELFGRELPDLDRKRMAIIYAKDKKSLEATLKSDGISWNFNGGGITYEDYNAAYQFPSGGLQYHLRYILLHECTHLYQLCLTGRFGHLPGWWVEGVADTLANHVWDEAAQRLTLNVVDKPTINNFYDDGLRRFQREPFTPSDANPRDAKSKTVGGRDVGFLLVTYFNTDVERSLKFRIWRDELLRLKLTGAYHERSYGLMDSLFGSWARLDEDFARWARARRSSFHYVEWGWEQDGDTLMSYGFPNKGTHAQTDLLHPPGEKPVRDPLLMDYIRQAESPAILGPVQRGIDEPSIGCVLGFRKNPGKGQAGFGLGVEERTSWRVLVDGDQRLIVDGTDLNAGKQETPLPVALRKVIAANGHQIGLTVKIGKDALEVLVRAGKPGALSEIKTQVPLTKQQRERLLAKPMTLLSRGGLHFVTPYIDVPLQPEPDPAVPAPPNRWRNPGDRQLYAVYRSAWRLGDRAPASLITLRTKMLASATASPAQQRQALEAFSTSLPQLLSDIRNSGAAEEAASDVLSWLGALQAGAPTELEKLKEGLQDPKDSARVAAIKKAKIADADASKFAELLVPLLADKNVPTQQAAAAALMKLGAKSMPALTQALQSKDAEVRRGSVRLLVQLGPVANESLKVLSVALHDKDWQTRRTVALGLAKLGGDGMTELIEVVENSSDPFARAEAVFALGTLGANAKNAIKSLVEAARDGNLHVRTRAVAALDEIAPDAVAELLGDPDSGVRVSALNRIKAGPARKAMPTLLKLLRDRDEEIRSASAKALARIGPAILEEVAPLLKDKEPGVRRAALQALDSHVTPAFLGKFLGDDRAEVGRAAAEALAKRESAAFAVLREGLRSKDFRVQRNSANAIVPMTERADDLIPALVEALLAEAPEESSLAQAILRVNPVLGSRELAQKAKASTLITLLKKDIPDAQVLACLALQERGGPADDALPILTDLLKNPKTDVNVLAAAARAANALGPKDAASQIAPDLVARLVRGSHAQSKRLREEIMADQPAAWKSDSFESILSALYVGEFTDEANDWVIHHANASSTTGWSSPNFVRVLSLFHGNSKRLPRRLTPAAELALKDHFWRFLHEPTQGRGPGMLPMPIADVKVTLPIDRLVWTTSAYLALEVLKDDPVYKDRKMFGRTLGELHEEWTLWWREWAKQRPMFGLWSEMGFASHEFLIWPCLMNMHDCAGDPILKQRIKMLLDLTAIEEEQISLYGARAGRRGKKTGVGCGIDQWKDLLYGEAPRRFGEPCAGFNGIVWTTSYEMPTAAILLRKLNRPVSHYAIANHHFFNGAVYAYATPHYILASQLSQPKGSMEFPGVWHRLIFDDMNAIFFPMFAGNRRHMQYQNVYVTRCVGGAEARQTIDFSANLKTVERNGWFFASNGPAHVGIYIVGGFDLEKADRKELGPQRFDSIILKDSQATVLLHAGDVQTFGSFEKFQAAILQAPLKVGDESLHYAFPKMPALEFFRQPEKDLLVDGVRHQFRSDSRVFDSPYLQGNVGSSQFTVRVGSYSAVYDFEKNTVAEKGRK